MLSFVNKLNTQAPTQLAALKKRGEDQVTWTDAVSHWVNSNLANVPAFVPSHVNVTVPQHRNGYDFTMEVELNRALWAVCLLDSLENRMVRTIKIDGVTKLALEGNIGTAFQDVEFDANWSVVGAEFSREFLNWMINNGYVEGQSRMTNVNGTRSYGYKITPLITDSIEAWLRDAKTKALPIIMPLNEQCPNWKLDGTNESPLINWTLANHDQLSNDLVYCINKLQAVGLHFDQSFINKCVDMRTELNMKDDDVSKQQLALVNRVINQGTKEFYTAMKCDDRLRMYYKGMLQPQQMELVRKELRFADGAPVKLFDAHCSGVQHIAAIFGNGQLAKMVNLESDQKNDFYSAVAQVAWELALTAEDKRVIKEAGRNGAKLCVLHGIYGASENSTISAIMAGGNRNYGLEPMTEAQARLYLAALNKVAPEIKQYLKAMKSVVEHTMTVNPRTALEWNLPNGQLVRQNYKMADTFNIGLYEDADGHKAYHYTAKDINTFQPDAAAHERAIAPNFIHSLDAHFLRMVIKRCKFEVVAIHDCIGCREENVEELCRIWTECFEELYSGKGQACFVNFLKKHGFEPEQLGLKFGGWKPKAELGQYMLTEE